jgi:hypothetical protein
MVKEFSSTDACIDVPTSLFSWCHPVEQFLFSLLNVHFLEWLVPAPALIVPCLHQPAREAVCWWAKAKSHIWNHILVKILKVRMDGGELKRGKPRVEMRGGAKAKKGAD